MNIENQFTVNLKNRPEIAAQLNQVAEKEGCTTQDQLLDVLLKSYQTPQKQGKTAPRDRSAIPTKAEGYFIVKIDPRDKEKIQQMRDDLYDQHGWGDSGILRHWAKVHHFIKLGEMLMIRLPKAIAERFKEKIQPMIDEGDLTSGAQYVARLLKDHLSKKEKKESSGFFG